MYKVVRSLVLPFTVLLSWFALKKPSSLSICMSCLVIFLGFLRGTTLDHLSIFSNGFSFGIISSFTTALHAIIIKKSITVVDGKTMDLVYYNNVLSACLLTPFVLLSGNDLLQI